MSDDPGLERRLSALRWRCRRGMRELDWLFDRHLNRLAQAGPTVADLDAVEALLDEEDDALWDWLTGRADPPPAHADIVHRIRRPGR